MADDVVLNKVAAIERCLARVHEEYDPVALAHDFRRQDSVVLNLQRACQAAIDLALYLVRREGLGLPQQSRDGFRLLTDAGRLDPALATRLEAMVGFRNVAVHDYQTLDLDVVRSIVETRLGDLTDFCAWALQA